MFLSIIIVHYMSVFLVFIQHMSAYTRFKCERQRQYRDTDGVRVEDENGGGISAGANHSVDKHRVEYPVCRLLDHSFDRRKAQ